MRDHRAMKPQNGPGFNWENYTKLTGDLKNAEMHYMISLQYRPGYAYALAGLGRIATASKEYDKAIAYYMQADSLVNDTFL